MFILASSSPRRLQLLSSIGRTPDQVIPADIDETPLKGELPRPHADRLALEKALTIARQYPNAIVLAADTVVACGRRILPKTENEAEARYCLELLSGRRHRVHGGVVVVAGGRTWQRHVETVVKFKRLTASEIDAYVASGEWRGKAGGYGVQGRAGAFVSAISGSYTNIVGLCVYTAGTLLSAAGLP